MRELFAHSLVRIVVAIRLGEGAVGGAELVGALLPVLDLLAGPGLGLGGVGVAALEGGAVGEAAVVTLEHDAERGGVVPELGTAEGVRGLAFLNPVNEV
jgi:hypothetical protein